MKQYDLVLTQADRLEYAGIAYRAATGKGEVALKLREGDGITPRGTYPLRHVFFRPDRIQKLITPLPCVALTKLDGWCDDAAHPAYNTHVQLPFSASHEKLWREDNVYDIIVVLGYNDAPVIAGKGSAIFMHLAQPDWRATEGCVAITEDSMRAILAQLTPRSRIHIL